MPTAQTDPREVGKRIAAQVQAQSEKIDALHASGDILNGNLLPPEAKPEEPAKPQAITEEAEPELPPSLSQYKSLEAAGQGYHQVIKLAREAQAERDQLRERLAALQSSSPPAPAATPPTPKVHPSADFLNQEAVVKLANETGIDARQLAEFAQTVYNEAANRAQAAVDERLLPIQAQAQAQVQFNALHPEASQFQAEIAAYVGSMPKHRQTTVQDAMEKGHVLEAMELVYEGFQMQRQASAQVELKDKSQATEPKRAQQRAQAALPQSSQNTPIHAASDDTPDPKMLADLAERARKGDQNAQILHRRLTFGRMMPPGLRTWEQQ